MTEEQKEKNRRELWKKVMSSPVVQCAVLNAMYGKFGMRTGRRRYWYYDKSRDLPDGDV